MKEFSIALLTKSATATRFGFIEQFTPPVEVIENGKLLYDMILSKIPFDCYIESFYRCDRLNTKVKGSKTSDHKLGRSADVDSYGNNKKIYEWVTKNCEFDQAIWEFGTDNEPDWCHFSYRKNNNRNQMLRAYKVKGRTIYVGI